MRSYAPETNCWRPPAIRITIKKKLNFNLDRKSLETIYIAFIRPLIEYGYVIWDNCSLYEKQELDKIQNEAARIFTGATRLVSISALYKEIWWDSLEQRRKNHRLCSIKWCITQLLFIYHSLVPPSFSTTSRYSLIDFDDLQTIDARTTLYYIFFLPSTARAWYDVTDAVKQSEFVNTFKSCLNKDKMPVPEPFYVGSRKVQILRTSSSLNLDLFLSKITNSLMCQCNTTHNTRPTLFFSLQIILPGAMK